MDDRFMLKLAEQNIKADYLDGKISSSQYRKEMAVVWNYRLQITKEKTDA